MKKKCELCKSAAKLFCESDQATLCWECDAKVHSANFLVSKHPRILLCHVCQSLTAWYASGPKFVPTLSVCSDCVTKNDDHHHHGTTRDDDIGNDDDVDGDEEDEDDDDDDDDENQVVPWTSSSSSTSMPPPPVSTSSNSANTNSSSSD